MPIEVIETGDIKTISMYPDALDGLPQASPEQIELWRKHNTALATAGNLTCFFIGYAAPATRPIMISTSFALSIGAVIADNVITAYENPVKDKQIITLKPNQLIVSTTLLETPPITFNLDQLTVRKMRVEGPEGEIQNCLSLNTGTRSINLGWFLKTKDLNALQDHIQSYLRPYQKSENDKFEP